MKQDDLTRTLVFNFKKVKASTFTQEVQESEDFKQVYDVFEKDNTNWAKRKPETVQQTLPAFIMQLPEEEQATVADLIEGAVSSYIKDEFIDQFKDVPELDWKKFKAWLASRGSRAKFDFSETQLDKACALLSAYIAELTGVAEVGERLAKAAMQKFSQSAIKSQLNNFDPTIVEKVKNHVLNWSGQLAETDEDTAEDLAPVIECWKAALDRHLRALEEAIDVGNYL